MPQSQQQKVPKGGKNVARGVRHRAHTQSMRPVHIQRARERHIKNALRSCGKAFAENLRLHYAKIGVINAPKKCKRAHS